MNRLPAIHVDGPRTHLDLQSSHRCIHPARLVTLVLFSSTLVESGMAQVDSFVILLAVITPLSFLLICGFIAIIFCCICCIVHADKNSTSNVNTFNARERPTQQVIYPQATPSAFSSQPYPVQSNYPQPVPSQPAYTEPQQVSLPEATLHQGDAPPGYEEAVRFTTVNIVGQQNVTSATDISS